MRVLCVLGLCLAAVCCGMPTHDVELLGEDTATGYVHQYGKEGNELTAVVHPHRSKDPNFKWKHEAAVGHAHCAHCHANCHTTHCHEMCSSKFCEAGYVFKEGKVDYLKASGKIIPSYAAAIKAANAALDKTKDARDDETMETATELVQKAQVQGQMNKEHWERLAQQTDKIDRGAYSGRQAAIEDDKTYILEEATTKQESALAEAEALASAAVASKNAAFVSATDTVSETGGFSRGTSMMSAVEEANDAGTEAENTLEGNGPTQSLGSSVASVADTEAELERASVKASAAADAAAASD